MSQPNQPMNRQMKRMMQRQGQLAPDGSAVAPPREPRQRPTRSDKKERTSPLQFFREVRTEMRKVAWPTRAEVVNYSLVVLVTLIVLITIIALLDFGFSRAARLLFG